MPASTLIGLAPGFLGFGEATRVGGISALDARLPFCIGDMSLGIAGTGGASVSAATPLSLERAGDGERKVRSLIEPLLMRRCIVGAVAALAPDATEALRCMRFVWTVWTGAGED